MIGETIYQYKILEKIGSGGMGVVYLAEDTRLNRQVALKFLPDQYISDENFKVRFMREAQAAAKLNHPNIITIYEVNEYNGHPFIAMELAEGKSLEEIIKGGELPTPKIIDISFQLCEGLKEAHKAGIVHRDIKPANIIINKNERCKILDFGLAAIQSDERLTGTRSFLGTVEYMSPEQVRGEKVDHRSDIFSLGVMLYEMITGQLPFKGDYVAGVIYSIINEIPEMLDKHRSALPGEFQSIIDRTLEKDRGMRYQNVEDLLTDLRKLRSGLGFDSSTAGPPSIAVLPFRDMSSQQDQEYFCDGIAEEVINALAQIENIRIVARTSSFAFKGQDTDIREIGRKLKVMSILEGSVRKAGERMRITAQLINVSDGYHLWSERYDCNFDDVFAIQDQISLSIVDNLKVKLLGGEKARLVKRYVVEPEAYKEFLTGIHFLRKVSEQNLYRSIDCFNKALEKYPNYSQAYAGISSAYIYLGFTDYAPPMEVFPKAKTMALKAIECEPDAGEGHTCMGFIKIYYEWDWEGARREFEKSLELQPNFITAHSGYACYFMAVGDLDEAIKHGKKAVEMDPLGLPSNMYLGLYYLRAGRLDLAREQIKRVIDIEPNVPQHHWLLGQTFILESKFDEGIGIIQKAVEMSNNNTLILGGLGWAYGVAGRAEEAYKIINTFKAKAEREYIRPFYIAKIYSALGENGLAFEWLDKAYDEHDISLFGIYSDETLSNIRSDPRFEKLLKKMRLI
ncbi:MAG: protein kinase [Candidatus Zixiibacteriota bacterium]|nr:MAG: protein kinase [candidate division Zixibacteria bacterium]